MLAARDFRCRRPRLVLQASACSCSFPRVLPFARIYTRAGTHKWTPQNSKPFAMVPTAILTGLVALFAAFQPAFASCLLALLFLSLLDLMHEWRRHAAPMCAFPFFTPPTVWQSQTDGAQVRHARLSDLLASPAYSPKVLGAAYQRPERGFCTCFEDASKYFLYLVQRRTACQAMPAS